MATFVVSLERRNSRKINLSTIEEQLEYIVGRGIGGSRSNWDCVDSEVHDPKDHDGFWNYKAGLIFKRKDKKGIKPIPATRLTAEMTEIVSFMNKAATSAKFGQFPWVIKEARPEDWQQSAVEVMAVENAAGTAVREEKEFAVEDVVDFDQAKTLQEIHIPDVLLSGTDAEIEEFPAFKGIFGRAPHIRILFSSIRTMIDTEGRRRNHVLLHGLPACAKSSLFRGVQMVLGKGAYLSINANSATRAGIEAIFLDRLKITGVPPFMFVEEMEKTIEAILTVWLSVLDERAEVRKITHSQARKQETRILCFAAVNDKFLFDRLMGGRPGHPGALSSRFNKPLYVPRPDRDQMRRILLRDIELFGGKKIWADKCLEIADEIGTNDPRTVLSFLDGGERLLNDSYKEDILTIHRLEQEDKKHQLAFEAGGEETL